MSLDDEERVELLENIINGSKEFRFKTDDILNIRDYYTGRKSINIDFSQLIDILYKYEINVNDVEKLLLLDEEIIEDED